MCEAASEPHASEQEDGQPGASSGSGQRHNPHVSQGTTHGAQADPSFSVNLAGLPAANSGLGSANPAPLRGMFVSSTVRRNLRLNPLVKSYLE